MPGNSFGLRSGFQWGNTSLSYTLLRVVPSYYAVPTDSQIISTFSSFVDPQEDAVPIALGLWERYTYLSFVELIGSTDPTAAVGDITFGNWVSLAQDPGEARYPGVGKGGDIWISTDSYNWPWNANPSPGTFGFYTLLHEVGHALGLRHSHESGGLVPDGEDNWLYTVMSYNRKGTMPSWLPADWTPSDLMLYDIEALQSMYGQNYFVNADNDTYQFSTDPLNPTVRAFWDGNGEDTFDASNQGRSVRIDLTPGDYNSAIGSGSVNHKNIAIVTGADIENAIGSPYDDILTGNALVNRLLGGAGNDVLNGKEDNDRLEGGDGIDTYQLRRGDGRDRIVDHGQNYIDFYDEQGNRLAPRSLTALGVSGASSWRTTDGLTTFVLSGPDLSATTTDGFEFVIDGWASGDFGIILAELPARPGPEISPIVGDLAPIDADTGTPGVQYSYDALGNVVVDPGTPEPDRADVLYDGPGVDLIQAKGGNDVVNAWRGGDDLIEAGAGADVVSGGPGKDVVYAAAEVAIDVAYAIGNTQAPAGSKGDWLDGAAGDDVLVGDAGDDALAGGAGGDVLFGSGGADNIFGDLTSTLVYLDWTITRETEQKPNDLVLYRTVFSQASVTESPVGGADTIHGGAGVDWIFGGKGDDYIDGGPEDDVGFGNEGHDTLLGGDGVDALAGDSADDPADPTDLAGDLHGSDYLSGGAGADRLNGNGGDDWLFGDGDNDELGGDDGTTPGQYHGMDYVDGGPGADRLWGGGKSDVLIGGTGDDHLEGDYSTLDGQYHGADRLEGGAGNDELIGQGGADELWGGADNDTMAGDGPGILAQYEGADRLFGEDGSDILNGDGGDDLLDGGFGNDYLQGGEGRDTLVGGPGTDTLDGGPGDDILKVDGADTIVDTQGNNTIVLTALSAGTFTLGLATDASSNQYLTLTDATSTTVAILGGFLSAVDAFEFDDGTPIDLRTLIASVQVTQGFTINGTAQADVAYGARLGDTLDGKEGDDSLEGGLGADMLIGGEGSDIYRFARGDGADTIDNTDPGPTAVDKLRLTTGILTTDVVLTRNGDNLVVQVRDTADQVTVLNHFTTAPIDQIVFDDATTWDQAAIASRLVSALTTGPDNYTGTSGNDFIQALAGNDTVQGVGGDDYIDGGPGFDNLYGGLGNDVIVGGADGDNLYGQGGNDVLNGGAGTDYLDGNTGNDTFEFARGGEQDTILAYDTTAGAIDKLKLAADIVPSDVFLRRDTSNHLVLTVNGTVDRVTVSQHFTNTNYALDQIVFDDGTIWDATVINAKVLEGTASADYLIGYATDDAINGLAGADTIYGYDGADTIDGGADGDWIVGGLGSDALQGGSGVDTIYGDDGNDAIDAGADGDSVQGGAGDDSLRGGTGTDTIYGDAGNDTFHYAAGDGTDTLYNNDASTLTTDTLLFGTGILPANLVLARANTSLQDLVITFAGASGQLTIPDYFTTGSAGAIDEIRFASDVATVWTVASVKAVLAPVPTEGPDSLAGFDTADTIDGLGGDDSINGLAGNDTLRGGSGKDTIYGGSGDDQLDGGSDNDTLRGGMGNDTYLFGRGGGYDRIEETTGSDGADTLRLNPGVAPADVTLYRHGDDLVATISGDPAQLWISQYFSLANKPTEQIVFDDATVWDGAAIAARVIAGTQNAMTGTAGNDTFVVDHVGDTITEGASQGTDTVQSWVTYFLPANVENLTLTGILHVNATGNSLPNTITGNAGDNVLDGGYDQLTDVLSGGAGNDSYLIGDSYAALSYDTVVEAPGAGVDTVFASTGDYTLEANVENLVMTGNTLVVRRATGNALDNVISIDPWAGSGHEYLIDGGTGADRMVGGYSKDTYVVDNVGDVVVEEGVYVGGGQASVDGVKSSVDYVLGANLEDLELQLGSGALIGTGNTLNNSLAGNANANTLTGLGGDDVLFGERGADTLIGGAGNDTYILADYRFLQSGQYVYANVSTASVNEDTIIELAGEGTDTVKSLFDYTLGDTLENLELLKYTGGVTIIPVQAIGNALANRITGNDGNNVIDGRAGADVMDGGLGNDTYYVDDVGDVVVESSSYGGSSTADTVISQVSYALGTAVENLTLVGANALTGTGNELGNVLDGAQSAAANVLTGGLGDDLYLLGAGDTALENAGEGTDTVFTSESYTLGQNVENLVLTGTLAITGTGDAGDNTLDGSQNSAANTLVGGLGNDTYFVDGGDLIVENPGEGTDTVVASFDYTLAANLENLTLDDGAANGTGNAEANVLLGNDTDNVLDGAGGADTLRGSSGNDTYVVDDAGDVVDETHPVWGGDAGGADTVRSAVSYALGNYLENLVLTGTAATGGTGNSLDNTLDGSQNGAANTLAGGAGNDTYVVDGSDIVVENAGEGTDTVRSASTVTLGANVENLVLIGTSAVNGTGNSAANTLTGNSAANTLDGGTGADTMIGGAGDDTYVVDNSSDVVTENTSEGTDTILSSITRTLPNNVENLTLTGTSAINGTGNSLANVLRGNSAANTLSGGSGNDSYYVSTGDTVSESSGQGTDTVYSDVTWTLGSNLENLTLIGTANINATGNTLANVLTGNSGNNTLSGGTGADTMAGGAGDDTYVVDNTGDVITESAGGGTDFVQSSVTYTLSAEVENLTLTGTSAINGTGNASNNTLTGNSANNTLTGNGGDDWLDGGSGSDTMRGGLGNDTYVVAQTGAVVTENANEGTDTVRSGITYTLGSNLENLTLTGTTAINGTGNTLNNVLTGNSANNTLTGNAGDDWLEGLAGTDTMRGGTGNDTYVVAETGDVVTENANEGTDTVRTNITYTLGSNVENVILTGTAALNATGNTLNNALTGNTANNSLTGNAGADTLDGGAGSDTLTGGTGNDTYLLGRGHGADTIVENDSTGGNTDIAKFLAGVANDQVWLRQVGNNLEASIIGTSDLFVAKDWYLGTQYRVEQFQTTDGNKTLLQANVQNLVNAMAAFSPPPPGQTTLPPDYQAALSPVIAANWQ